MRMWKNKSSRNNTVKIIFQNVTRGKTVKGMSQESDFLSKAKFGEKIKIIIGAREFS